ncbi:flavin reductase family protein [Actibacterium sp. 188UL27-1]|uniref:flavin reductase family protein n=1 Tax=Actibacterium sp. 188UL27-1 TaxID=2786961 RepID=UPI00195EC621|nr:flavin reductase family protein [Actibacterium sp. 188UL27-1]MBM7070179.1 flavin reductase family protein [Actibacterium sp. 188UL27-1]
MTLSLDLDAMTPALRYKLLTAVVLPRPVAWVTTLAVGGTVNAAPYSFFNLFGQDPALVILGLQHRADGSPKDTTENIGRTGEFVVNIATPSLNASMVDTAATYPSDVSEAGALDLGLAASTHVAPPRLADVPVAIECRLLDRLTYSAERDIVVGKAVGLAARDGLIDTDTWRVDWKGDYPVARLFADRYARLDEIEPRSIPTLPELKETP